jgi:hypothetical protein
MTEFTDVSGAFGHSPPPGAATGWLAWRRRHQALSAWYYHRTRLARDEKIVLLR